MQYEGRIFRPPSEADSLILQSTVGCSQNGCAFCSMYKEKKFHIRPLADVCADVDEIAAGPWAHAFSRVFLADGDALMRKTEEQLAIFPTFMRACPAAAASPAMLRPQASERKHRMNWKRLRRAGLTWSIWALNRGATQCFPA